MSISKPSCVNCTIYFIYNIFSVVWIYEMIHDDFYHSGFSDYCLHLYYNIHNVLANMSSGLLQVSYWTWERTWNFEPCLLFNPQELLALIWLTITRYKCYMFLYCYSPSVRTEPANIWLSLRSLGNECL